MSLLKRQSKRNIFDVLRGSQKPQQDRLVWSLGGRMEQKEGKGNGQLMLTIIVESATEQRLRLFMCHDCRYKWHLLLR